MNGRDKILKEILVFKQGRMRDIFQLTFSSQSFIGSFKGSTSYSLVQAHFAAGYRLSSYSYGINMIVKIHRL